MRHRSLVVEQLEGRQLLSTLPAGFQESTVATGFNPTGMDFAPDGRLFVANKNGVVSIVQPDGTTLATPFFSVAVDTYRDRGLDAVLVDPNFAQNHYVYLLYTAAVAVNPNTANNGAITRLVRVTASASNPNIADPASMVALVDNIPSPTGILVGGFLRFGSDGMLYAGIGSGDIVSNAQDLSNLYGKVLRLDAHNYPNLIPADNPFVGQAGKRGEIWAYGFRNPFSGDINPTTNEILVNDVGSDQWEEINRVVKGANYGWPLAEGNSTNTAFTNPLFTYSHGTGGAASIGGTFDLGASFPASYFGQYFVGDVVQGVFRVLDPASGQTPVWATGFSLPTAMRFGPDGNLYYTSIANGTLYKISYVGSANRPPNAVATSNVTSGVAPLTVSFSGAGSTDPDGEALTYAWNFGDGTTGSGVTVQHTYAANGTYNVVLTVTDTRGLPNSAAPLAITVGNQAPQPTIVVPLVTAKYTANQTIVFSGSAVDPEDGTLPPSAYHWSFRFGHNTHSHDFIGPIDGVTSGSFVADAFEPDADQYYRIQLTVTDSQGLSTTTIRDIRPVLSTFTIASNVAGASLSLDSQPIAAGTTVTGVVGMLRTLSAPLTQLINGRMYRFVSWSDGGAATHTIATSASATTYTAQYQAMPLAATYTSNTPQRATPGQTLTYQVTVKNVGTQTWNSSGTNRVQLGVYFGGASDAVGAWLATPVRFSMNKNLAPGKSFTFNVKVTAPTASGSYVLRNRMIKNPSTWFETIEKTPISVGSQTVIYSGTPPTIWGAGQAQRYSITVTNTGTTAWISTGSDRVRLAVYFGGSSDTPGTGTSAPARFDLPNDVAPGASATLTIDVNSPATAGDYTLRHRLVNELSGYFNDILRTSAAVELLSAQYVVTPPTEWSVNEVKTYSITLVNTGTKTWNALDPYAVHLGVYFAGDNDAPDTWPEEPVRTYLPRDVLPGQSITLSISVKAPAVAGNYVLRHRMVKEFVNWFIPLQKSNVTVR